VNRHELHDRSDEPTPGNGSEPFMEIGSASRRSIVGFISYVLLVGAVCTVLVWLFARFTRSLWLGITLVLFMVGYMLLMGWWASRRDERSQ
jgi:hypothetical protein